MVLMVRLLNLVRPRRSSGLDVFDLCVTRALTAVVTQHLVPTMGRFNNQYLMIGVYVLAAPPAFDDRVGP